MNRTEYEIQKIGEMYRTTESEEARKSYADYINLVILDSPRAEQSRLEDMWEWEIE